MRKFALLFLLISLVSCNEKSKTTTPTTTTSDTKTSEILNFKRVNYKNEAIILTDTIQIYDTTKKIINQITNIYGEVVTIDSISEKKFNLQDTKERCDLHNFVWVKSNKFSGWIFGDYIFEKENRNRNINYIVGSLEFKFIPTKNFNVGVYDEEMEELSFCKNNQSPILFYNGRDKKYQYIKINDNQKIYTDKYLTLDSHDGWYDEIKSIGYKDNILSLLIKREYQEGNATIELEIYLDTKQSIARVIKFTKGKENESTE